MKTEKLKEALALYTTSYPNKSSYVFLDERITPELLSKHKKRYAQLAPTEEALLVVNNNILGSIAAYGWSGILISEHYLYYRCLKDSFFSSLVALPSTGKIPLSAIDTLVIGAHDTCFGTAYIGHKLVVNGKSVGLLRMGGAIQFDDNTIASLNYIFQQAQS